jgi:NDP-sugar pyrophosphorylase family protein
MPDSTENRMEHPLQAAILVGGKGTRLRSVVSDRPKPMAEVAGKPFLEWILIGLRDRDVSRIVLCSGYMPEFIENHFGDGIALDLDISYSVDPYPLGTGGAVRFALGHLSSSRILVLNGDSYCDFDIERLTNTHEKAKAVATIWTTQVEDSSRFGSIDVSENGEVLAFHEKQASHGSGIVNAGVYLVERDMVSEIPEGRAVSLETDVFPELVGRGLYAVRGDSPFLDIGTPESFSMAEDFLSLSNKRETVNIDH